MSVYTGMMDGHAGYPSLEVAENLFDGDHHIGLGARPDLPDLRHAIPGFGLAVGMESGMLLHPARMHHHLERPEGFELVAHRLDAVVKLAAICNAQKYKPRPSRYRSPVRKTD